MTTTPEYTFAINGVTFIAPCPNGHDATWTSTLRLTNGARTELEYVIGCDCKPKDTA